jgi:hypothetical protein
MSDELNELSRGGAPRNRGLMKNCISVVVLLFVVLSARFGFSEVDPAAVLPGTWDGWFETIAMNANPHRILIIESVVPNEGGGWIAKSRFGDADSKLRPYDIEVSRKGDDIVLKWIFGIERIPIEVKLVGTDKMEGYSRPWRYSGGSTTTTKLGAKLEKLDKKAPTQ